MTGPRTLDLAERTGHAPWVQTDAPQPPTRRMRVAITTDVGRRFEYEALFRSTFDAYDDALARFPHVSRIQVQPAKARDAQGEQEPRHAR
jgi:hypothetical protein